ncbi:MAG TPA: FGGY family carbohydrate kinase, partial [Acidimicrobiales bacterium]|nr:FGGY family carbohydrate kinase [Acidimicrobiales bacterium]
MPLVVGVDSSTTATKVEVRDLDTGQVVGGGSSPHPPTQPPRSEQWPSAWWEAFEAAWGQAGDPDVAAVSVAGQQHGMVALDDDRSVIRPAKLWNDTESAPEAVGLIGRLPGGRQAWADACGLVPVASFTITKLAWRRRHEPRAWERLAHVILPHDWLTLVLTDQLVTDRGDASGTGYWSAASGMYRQDLLALVDAERDWSGVVPRVLGPLEAAGEWNGALVGPGTGDNMAGALGVGLRPGDVVVSIGTSGTVYTVSDEPTADASGIVAGFADATGRHLPLVCTLNATKVTD